jgi:hypothetical protein
MKAVSLIGVLLLAKLLTVAGRDLPLSIWTLSALVWQDVAVGAAFAGVVAGGGWRLPVRTVYWTLVLWIAVNVPVARTLSSALTVPMLRATGGALTDSIALYATPLNVGLLALVIGSAVVLPRLTPSTRLLERVGVAVALVALPGPWAASSLDMRGTQRNAMTALLATAIPRVSANGVAPGLSPDWRVSPFRTDATEDLRGLEGRARGRNVVMITLESTGARYLRSYGAGEDPMPTLTALAQTAVQFDAAYAVYPESIKGLFSVLCSRHPAMDVTAAAHARAPCTPLPVVLASHGYQTALFHSGRFGYLGMQDILARQRFHTADDAGAIGGEIESSFGVDEPSTVAHLLSWIDRRDRRRPFFVSYMPIAGHHPYDTPVRGPFAGQGELSAYQNALRYGDESLAALLDGLRARGLDGDTLIVVFGDHGEAFGQHDGNFGHTFFAFDENVRVPLLFALPGVTTVPQRSSRVASLVDIAPTILALLGIPEPSSFEGSSVLRGGDELAFFFTDYALLWAGLRDGCWKYLLEVEADRSRLFNVCRDAEERTSMASSESARVTAYRARVLAWIAVTRSSYLETRERSAVVH